MNFRFGLYRTSVFYYIYRDKNPLYNRKYMKNCFWAYSNKPHTVEDSIDETIKFVNDNEIMHIVSWTETDTIGRFIIDEVTKKIEECDVFLCELSNINNNVLFELGYAIALEKQIRIFVNTKLRNVKERFDELGILANIGYHEYVNSRDIQSGLLSNEIQKYDLIESALSMKYSIKSKNIMYIKCRYETDSSIKLTRRINELSDSVLIDDPEEVMDQDLGWYINGVIQCNSLVTHLQSDSYEDAEIRNARTSLIAGIAYGLKIPLLMLVEEPFKTPVDYMHLLKVYSSKGCVSLFDEWYDNNRSIIDNVPLSQRNSQQELRALSRLQMINMGDSIAENESEELPNYYVKTRSFDDAIYRNLSIFIGRKGAGKTANLIVFANEFRKRKNHVCIIKPVAYEIDGVIEILKKLSNADKGYLVESIWKYLIYTELIKSIYIEIEKFPPYKELDENESEIKLFVENNEEMILPEFSSRLEIIINKINGQSPKDDQEKIDKTRISELLHHNIISRVRGKIGEYCKRKRRIAILIDNLDKAWQPGADIKMLSTFLFGLLEVGESIIKDFSKDSGVNKPVDLSLIIFLREDIFALMDRYIPERDKIQVNNILWDDKEILLRIVEERIQKGENIDIWKEFFCNDVNGVEIKDYVAEVVLPRPRDVITLTKSALANAINRRHSIIECQDILDATTSYSKFAVNALITEMAPEFQDIRCFIDGLLAEGEIIDKKIIKKALDNSTINNNRMNELITFLCKLSFLGIEISENKFVFCYSEEQYRRYDTIAEKYIEKNDISERRYKIHKAFHEELMIEER